MSDALITGIYLQLLYAALLGLTIGFEREHYRKAAGMRTYALVCFGSALFTIISVDGFSQLAGSGNIDPTRIASQIVTGIGFIGGGLIFFHGDKVQGLTTAAAIWVTAAIGVAVGIGMYEVAFFSAIVTLILMWALRFLEEKIPRVELEPKTKSRKKQ